MNREGEGGMIEESTAKKRAVRKPKTFKPIPVDAFENQQLSLFGGVSPNPRNFRHTKSSPSTIASRSMTWPSPRNV